MCDGCTRNGEPFQKAGKIKIIEKQPASFHRQAAFLLPDALIQTQNMRRECFFSACILRNFSSLFLCFFVTIIEKITFPEGEKSIDNRYDSKSIRLDVYVHDENGHVYDIEMQCTNGSEGELPKRTRYYQGMIDMDELKKGQYYTALKESFIIFICTFDPFGENLPMYTFRHRCIEKEGLELGDLSTKIFLNAKGESDTLDPDIAAFLRYVDGKAAEGALTKEINEEVIRIKEHKEMRREYMTLLMELQKYKTEGMQEGIEIGMKQGMEKKGRTVIMNLLKLNMPIDNIAAATESPIPYVKEIAREAGYSV